jgi:hypothetical protein
MNPATYSLRLWVIYIQVYTGAFCRLKARSTCCTGTSSTYGTRLCTIIRNKCFGGMIVVSSVLVHHEGCLDRERRLVQMQPKMQQRCANQRPQLKRRSRRIPLVQLLLLLQLFVTLKMIPITTNVCRGEDEEEDEEAVPLRDDVVEEVIVGAFGDIVTAETTTGSTGIENNGHSDTTSPSFTDLQCRIWLAPSTLRGAGLGMFAGTDFHPEEEFNHGGDITIAITDIAQHNTAPGQAPYGTFLWDEYTWNAAGLKMDMIGYEQNIASEGFGSAANSFLPVYNVDEWAPRITYANELHRSRDPGVGASTQYHHRLSTSRRHIEAGEELYVSCTYHSTSTYCQYRLPNFFTV